MATSVSVVTNGSVWNATTICIIILFVVVLVLAMMMIDLYQRVPSNPLALVPFSASVTSGKLIGGVHSKKGNSDHLGVRGKELLRFGNALTDREGTYLVKTQAVHLFTIVLTKSFSTSPMMPDQFLIRQNTMILSFNVVPYDAMSYTVSLPLFCCVGDQMTFEYYSAGSFYGKNEDNKDALTVLNLQNSTMSVLVLPQQFPAKANYDPQIPYLQWSS